MKQTLLLVPHCKKWQHLRRESLYRKEYNCRKPVKGDSNKCSVFGALDRNRLTCFINVSQRVQCNWKIFISYLFLIVNSDVTATDRRKQIKTYEKEKLLIANSSALSLSVCIVVQNAHRAVLLSDWFVLWGGACWYSQSRPSGRWHSQALYL